MQSPGAVFLVFSSVSQSDKIWRHVGLFYTGDLMCLSKVECMGDQMAGQIKQPRWGYKRWFYWRKDGIVTLSVFKSAKIRVASWFPTHSGAIVFLKLGETQIPGPHPQSFQFSWVWNGAQESAFLTRCPVMIEKKQEGSQLDSGECILMEEQGDSIPLPPPPPTGAWDSQRVRMGWVGGFSLKSRGLFL